MAVVIGGSGGSVSDHFAEWLIEFRAAPAKGDSGVSVGGYNAPRVIVAALEQNIPKTGCAVDFYDPFVTALLAEL